MNNKPLCVISGPVFNRSGYGALATSVAKSILRYDKYDLLIAPTKWGGCPPETVDEKDPENILLANKFLREPLKRQPDIFFQISIPNEFQAHGKYNIGLTAGIEVDKPSGEFVEGMNRMNLGLVISEFNKIVFQSVNYTKQFNDGSNRTEQLKCIKPIEVICWGTNTKIFKKTEETIQSIEDEFNKIPEDFAFLFVGQWTNGSVYTDRKDIGNLIKTFCNTFKDKEKQPCLILKTSGVNFSVTDKYETLNKIKEVTSSIPGKLPNIYLIHGELKDIEMNALINHKKVKANISFTHGEGFGMPLLEATLSGKPILASNWSGHLDFLNPKYAHLLEGTLDKINPESANQWLIKEGNWFTVSYNLAADKMKNIFNHYSDKLLEKAELLRLENVEKYSLNAMDKNLWNLLDKYVPPFQIENQIIIPKLKKIELPKLLKK